MSRKKTDAEWLKSAREEMGLSQGDLAVELGMVASNISWYETGRTKKLPKLVRDKVEEMLQVYRLAPR